MGKAKGDAFAEVTRTMVENMGKEIREAKAESRDFKLWVQAIFDKFDGKLDKFEESIRQELTCVQEKQTDLFNHQSSRVPPQVVKKLNILYSVLSSIITATVATVLAVVL